MTHYLPYSLDNWSWCQVPELKPNLASAEAALVGLRMTRRYQNVPPSKAPSLYDRSRS